VCECCVCVRVCVCVCVCVGREVGRVRVRTPYALAVWTVRGVVKEEMCVCGVVVESMCVCVCVRACVWVKAMNGTDRKAPVCVVVIHI